MHHLSAIRGYHVVKRFNLELVFTSANAYLGSDGFDKNIRLEYCPSVLQRQYGISITGCCWNMLDYGFKGKISTSRWIGSVYGAAAALDKKDGKGYTFTTFDPGGVSFVASVWERRGTFSTLTVKEEP